MSKHERFTTAVNDSTGDLIKTKASGQEKYAKGWEAIFGKEKLIPYSPPTTAEQVLQKLTDEGLLKGNVIRRHEEQNIGKGTLTADDVQLAFVTPDGQHIATITGYAQDGIEQFIPFEEEHVAVPFVEEPLPSGIIGDEV